MYIFRLHNKGFVIKQVSFSRLKTLRNDASTVHDHIAVTFLKPTADIIASHTTHSINSAIDSNMERARTAPIPQINNPSTESDLQPVSILPSYNYGKLMKNWSLNKLLIL